MKHNVDINIDYFDRHLNKVRRNVSLACIFLIVLATVPVAIARAVDGWDINSLLQLISTCILISVFAYVYSKGYVKAVGIIIYCVDMVLMSVVTLDPQGNELIVLFFITPLLVAYLFFTPRYSCLVSICSYAFLSTLYFIQYVDVGSPSYHFELVLLVLAGISSIAGLHVVIGLRHSIEKKLIDVAHTDALTRLPNRMYFDERLTQEFSRADRDKTPLCLGLIDLDNFKLVNDTYGHECGDSILIQVAALVDESIRAEDIACRVGGEELAVIMPNTPIEEACETLERLRITIRDARFPWKSYLVSLTVSAGISEYKAPMPKDSVYAKADEALYRAKQQGRNLVACADINKLEASA